MPIIRTCLRLLLIALAWAWGPGHATNIVVATVNNWQFQQMQELTHEFERDHPGTKVRWVTLTEEQLRKAVSSDIQTRGQQFDVITIGMYEAPIWARKGWLVPIRPLARAEKEDLLGSVREGLSWQGKLFAMPFYGEGAMLYYRKDLFAAAGLVMPTNLQWGDMVRYASRLHAPQRGVYGICLRGKSGWGENVALVTTMANTYGAQWFDAQWRPQLNSQSWQEAVSLYVELLGRYGPPDAIDKGYNENLALFKAGQCAMWVDATAAAGALTDKKQNPFAGAVGFARTPAGPTGKAARWLWAWALAVPSDIDASHVEAAQNFIAWATSRAYIQRVATDRGWAMVPSGTRASTYADPRYQKVAPWAALELDAIRNASPGAASSASSRDATLPSKPYLGLQFVSIPEFTDIGDATGERIADALAGRLSVKEALVRSQATAQRRLLTGSTPGK